MARLATTERIAMTMTTPTVAADHLHEAREVEEPALDADRPLAGGDAPPPPLQRIAEMRREAEADGPLRVPVALMGETVMTTTVRSDC